MHITYKQIRLIIKAGIEAGNLNKQEYGPGPVESADGEAFILI